jgi:hypothetical protein
LESPAVELKCETLGPELALKRPTVVRAEGLLTEAVLKHAGVVPNRRP